MSRDNFDIPEVFRRAMEEAGWEGRRGEGNDGGKRPPFPRRSGSRRPNRIIWIIVILVALLLSLSSIVTTYTDWLWFIELDYEQVWLKQLGFRVLTFVIFFAITLVILLVNWHLARRRAVRETKPENPRILQIRGFGWIINGLSVILSFGFAGSISNQWLLFLRYLYRVPFGIADPIFDRDISFYLFDLPVFEALQQWIISLLVVTLLGVIAIHVINNLNDVQQGLWRPHHSTPFRRHVALVGGIILGLWAAGYFISIHHLVYSSRGVVFGASYTDVNASLYALYVQAALMALAALALLFNMFRLSLRPILATIGLWLVVAIVGGGIYPALLQRYSVTPNEIVRESEFINYNIEYTRLAFGLDNIRTQPYEIKGSLTEADLIENEGVLNNIRLWDYRPLQDTYTQLQALKPYYQFGEVDIDRYEIDGEMRQVMLATRELDKSQLPSRTWVNQNLEFTHGYGIVMNPVDKFTSDGRPEFFIQDLPPQSNIGLNVDRPEIYYGERTLDTVFVGSERDEFSYPSGNTNVYTSYSGTGGVPLDNGLKRLAFAIRLGDTNVILSNEINTQTRVQFNRQIQSRVRKITPFLSLDGDPYIVLWDGRLIWMQDAYTLSGNFPYSDPIPLSSGNRINYIRNAVKITVDAYNGTVTYYIADEGDPLIRAYDRAFPGLFHPLSDMPEGLRTHIRYPEDLFRLQMRQYLRYHMTDVRVFYNQEDVWEVPQELFTGQQQEMEPYYVIMPLPDETESEYLLIQPLTPQDKQNMIAWLAARNDPEHYGELVAYELPKQQVILGPSQVEATIDQQTEISQQFSLWDQRGSNIIRGNLIVIPLNNNFLYVEPVYLQAESNALPELQRVIVATATGVAMEETLEEALAAVLGKASEVVAAEDVTEEVEVETGTEEAVVETGETAEILLPTTTDDDMMALIESANSHFEAAQAAQQNGDWATYGEELEALESDLERLLELTELSSN